MVMAVLLLFAMLAGGILRAQPLLVWSENGPVQIASVRTFAGAVESQCSPVQPSAQIILLALIDSLSDDERGLFAENLTALYRNANPSHPLTLALLSERGLQTAGPFPSLSRLRSALRELPRPQDEEPHPSQTLSFYSQLPGIAAQLGSDWASLIVVGHPPPIDSTLEEYATTYLLRRFTAQRLRVSYWSLGGPRSPVFESLCRLTGGTIVQNGLAEVTTALDDRSRTFAELSWNSPALSAGLHLYRATLLTASGTVVSEVPWVSAGAGTELPSLEQYAELRVKARSGAALLKEQTLDPDRAREMRDLLQLALTINPRDREALRVGADFYKRYNDHKTAARLLAFLAETEAENPASLAEIGHSRFLAGEIDEAERDLSRSRELKPGNALVAEELGRIRVSRKDYSGAIPLFEESLQADAKNQAVWFLRADSSIESFDWSRAAESLEHGLALGGGHLPRRTALIRIYLDHNDPAKALQHVNAVTASLPTDASVRSAYAEFLERLHRPDEALGVWRQALGIDPGLELAHFRVARILLDKGDFTAALGAAETGIKAAQKSARLHLTRAEALDKRGLWYAARRELHGASASIADLDLLRSEAECEDTYGVTAARSYVSLAQALAKSSEHQSEYPAVLERGLIVSIRDGDIDNAKWFAARLESAGRKDLSAWLGSTRAASEHAIWIPGGTQALSFIARAKEGTLPERFLVSYARAVIVGTGASGERLKAYQEGISKHFRRVAALKDLGQRESNQVTITLAVADRKSRRFTEKVLNLLGWKMKSSKKGIQLEAGEGGSQAERQETSSALAIDEVGMKEALEAGGPFTLKITDDYVPVLLSEETWRDTFYANKSYVGGLVEAMVWEPHIARAYVGLSALNAGTLPVVLEAFGLKRLVEKYSYLLHKYSPALSVANGRATVPGGAKAEPVWNKLAGASPDKPAQFYRALFEKNDGRLLAFFYTLSQLDASRQRFFTLNPSRPAKFYDLFSHTLEMEAGAERLLRDSPFSDFLNGIPLDEEGHVRFPGSPEVWMVAKGQSSSTSHTTKLLKKVAKAAAPDVEDEILVRLAKTRYGVSNTKFSELGNFMAVAMIDEHRDEPLEESSALLLAQHFVNFGGAYPYLAVLTGLTQREFDKFFALGEKLRTMDDLQLNLVLGQLDPLIHLFTLAQQADVLAPKQAAGLFYAVCDRFARAGSPAEYAAGALDSVREMLALLPPDLRKENPDEAIRLLLFGSPSPVTFEFGGSARTVNEAEMRHREYTKVLDLQQAPPLGALLRIRDATAKLAMGEAPMELIRILEDESQKLLHVGIPKTVKVGGKERENLESDNPRKRAEIIRRMRQKASKRKVNRKDFESLSIDLLGEIGPQVKVALSGIIYAYYLRSEDLIVNGDPLLVRKHQFRTFGPLVQHAEVFSPSDLVVNSEGAGSHFSGTFASFSSVAGRAAAAGASISDGKSGRLVAKQIGSLRGTDWRHLRDEDLRLFALTVLAGHERILHAARQPDLERSLAEDSLGLLSLARRADLLAGLASRDWNTVWESVTLSDRYWLGVRYLERHKTDSWQSPVMATLRRLVSRNNGKHLDVLGAHLPETFGCSHPHLLKLEPYEGYEGRLFPTLLAERVAEFKLYLGLTLDRAGLPAALSGPVAEPLAREVLKRLKMSDAWDWHSVVAAYSSISEQSLMEVLPQP